MNVDAVLSALNEAGADYILIGGMNFLLRHLPEITFDIDVWVADSPENLERVNRALIQLGAEWGRTEASWKPVPEDASWLREQIVFCLTTRQGALDIFREVRGLEGRYGECKNAAAASATGAGVPFKGLSDRHMLEAQLALPEGERKTRRIDVLQRSIERSGGGREE